MEYDIESILEIYEDDYNPRPMAQEPRNMYKYAGIVKQGSNKGKHKYTDFYPKKTNGSLHEWFDSKKEMNEALQQRKEASGRGLTEKEITKKYKKQIEQKGYKTWGEVPDNIKRSISTNVSSPYEKIGPSKIKNKTIELLENKKPINSKTGLPYTQEEFIKLTPGQKTKLSLRMRDKKKPATWDERLGYNYGKKDNKLLNYMKEAAKQQEKLPVKDRTFINVYEQDGKKYVGVRDVKAKTLYTHVDYDLSKDGAKKGTVITSHPQVANPDSEFNVYRKAAEKFKYDSPDKLLKSYFSKYERVPTYNEIYNFFTMDRSAPASTMSKNNALTLQHLDVVAKNPTSNFQLLTNLKNTKANTIMNKLKRGEITEAKANYDLNKIGAGQEGYGVPKEKMTPGKGIGVAKRDAVKLFKDAYKVNPKVVEDITQKLSILGCPKGLQAASGGRIKFNKGTTCAIKGREVLEKGLKNGFEKGAQGDLAKKILGSGKFLKDAVSLRGLFGPAALAFTVAAEAGLVGYDMLSTGKSFREAVGDSVFNYALGDKTKIDSVEERDKRMVAEGMTPEQMGKIKYFESMMDDMQTGFKNYDIIKDLEKKIEDNTLNQQVDPQLFPDQAFQLDTQLDEARANNQDYFRTNKVGELENYFTPKKDGTIPFVEGSDTLQEGLRRNELAQLQSVNNPLAGRLSDEKRSARIQELMLQNPDIRNYMGSYPTNYGFMEGGIASLNVKK